MVQETVFQNEKSKDLKCTAGSPNVASGAEGNLINFLLNWAWETLISVSAKMPHLHKVQHRCKPFFMKASIITVLLVICSYHCCFSQLGLVKNNKIISLDTNRIWGIQTNSVLLLSIFDYKFYAKKEKYNDKTLYRLDTVKSIKKIRDTLEFAVSIVQHYRDTVSGEIYSNIQIEKEWNMGNFKSQRVLKDTIFRFAISDIKQLKVQTRAYRHTDAMGVVGMIVIGTGVTIYSIVTVLEGNENGYYGLALGAGMLGLAAHWLKKGSWLQEFDIKKNKWTINQ